MTSEKLFLYECVELIDTLNNELYNLSEKYNCDFVPNATYTLNNRYYMYIDLYFDTANGEKHIEIETVDIFEHKFNIVQCDNDKIIYSDLTFDDIVNYVIAFVEKNKSIYLM